MEDKHKAILGSIVAICVAITIIVSVIQVQRTNRSFAEQGFVKASTTNTVYGWRKP